MVSRNQFDYMISLKGKKKWPTHFMHKFSVCKSHFMLMSHFKFKKEVKIKTEYKNATMNLTGLMRCDDSLPKF